MLPTTHSEAPQEAAYRQANFIVLRTLESKLPPLLFDQIITNVNFFQQQPQASESFELPRRTDWTGNLKDLSFHELKVNFRHVDQNYLPELLQTVANGPNEQKPKQNLNHDKIQINPQPRFMLSAGLIRSNHLLAQKSLHLKNFLADQKKNLIYHQISRFERMKTVFGHALIEEDYNAPIYIVKFDQTGNFVISGADDGIIKIWDRDTLNLQAALHSHEDVITDMDISKCNQYLATASKDGKVILWDWRNCKKVDEIAAHNGPVNNIKFFSLKIKSLKDPKNQTTQEEIQILVTCSEDGTIKIYDEVSYLNGMVTATENCQRKGKTRQQHQHEGHKRERFEVVLTPEDFRPGSKNKKIDSVHINQYGLIAAGSDKGEVFLWELDLGAFKKQQIKCYSWLGSSKKHTKSVHFCEFSPNGKQLFTGSVDGTAKIWNVDKDKNKKNDPHAKFLGLSDDRLLITLEQKKEYSIQDKETYFKNHKGETINMQQHKEKKNTWQCDSLVWSAYGRYAIAAFSGKYDDKQNQDISIIKVWDSCSGDIIKDITSGNNVQLVSWTFVLAPHPKIEEIFLSGSDGGIICLWNIKTRSLIKKFLEYGIYSFEKYTMNDPYDGRFSPDGNSFVVSSVMGTISLFSCDLTKYKYEATRVEQFLPQDDKKHPNNIYYQEEDREEPQVCKYNLIPYEVQPPSSLIGKFKNATKLTHEEYERNFTIRRELCMEEENFNQEQLEEGLRNNMFISQNGQNNALFENDADSEVGMVRGRRPRIDSQLSQISQNINQDASEEDVEALNNIRNAERRRGRQRGRRQNIAGRVNRQIMSPHFDPDNDHYDRDSDENFEIAELSDEESEVEEEVEEESEETYGVHTRVNRQQRGRVNVREENYTREENKRAQQQELSRHERALRRQARFQEEEKGVELRNNRGGRRAIVDESEEEISATLQSDYEMSDVAGGNRPRLQRNNRGNKVESSEEVSSESEAISEDDVSEFGIRTRKSRAKNQNKRTNAQAERNGRNLRSRNNRKKYVGMDESSESFAIDESDDEEEEKEKILAEKIKEEEKGTKRRVIEDESDEEMVNQDVKIPDKYSKQKGDEDYELQINNNLIQIPQRDDNEYPNNQQKCGFCLRDDGPLIGPFVRTKGSKTQQKDIKYFHKDCIEVNEYSFFHPQKGKWLNIGKALEQFSKRSYMCARCNMIGATIKCGDCSKYYHGYLCSTFYIIQISGKNYQCFECRNKVNYKMFRDKEPQIDGKEVKIIKRTMVRDHLMQTKQTFNTYIPQVGDVVYYFFQGHEKFISYYNCFFYSGDSERLNFSYPWKEYAEQLETPALCKVISMTHRFPSKNSLYLLKRYGKSGDIQQLPQIITQLELEIVSNDEEEMIFSVEIFPNELPDFLVLKNMYEQSMQKYDQLVAEKKFIGQVFKVRSKDNNKGKVVDIIQQKKSAFEPETNWECVLFRHDDAQRSRDRNRRQRRASMDDNDPPQLMNFWDLILNENISQEEDEKQFAISDMDANDREKIVTLILNYQEKKKDQVAPFIERVTEKIAKDYKDHITAEMFINLILERINNCYYRTFNQLFCDFDLIAHNARLYNGDESELTHNAKKFTDKIKKEIKREIILDEQLKKYKHEETKITLNIKPPGKMTAPPRLANGITSMDYFMNTQEYPKINGSHFDKGKVEDFKSDKVFIDTSSKGKKPRTQFQMNENEINVNIDASDSSDFKATPKTLLNQYVYNPPKRQTRQVNRENYNENETVGFSTGEKQADVTSEGIVLGKRTRSGRQQKVLKQSLNEDELDIDFEDSMAEFSYNGAKKRLRHL